MFYVIAEPCVGVKDKACVEVCPVDCIHGGDTDAQMFINPDECIFCGGCESECPVEAIFFRCRHSRKVGTLHRTQRGAFCVIFDFSMSAIENKFWTRA